VSVAVSETEAVTEEREASRVGPLPDDFPHRELLEGAGFGTFEALRAASDEELLKVEGLAEARVRIVRKAQKKF
jgi:hypothetical protein